ncbi:unnamed protein product [Amoebophrya sp. A120]|nr:unnamed protein product [Amoebophrya sp. A120]|eukprot:GSA120T00021659001.1
MATDDSVRKQHEASLAAKATGRRRFADAATFGQAVIASLGFAAGLVFYHLLLGRPGTGQGVGRKQGEVYPNEPAREPGLPSRDPALRGDDKAEPGDAGRNLRAKTFLDEQGAAAPQNKSGSAMLRAPFAYELLLEQIERNEAEIDWATGVPAQEPPSPAHSVSVSPSGLVEGEASSFAQAAPEHFDVVVVGSGGGLKIAHFARGLGLKVAVIEKGFWTAGWDAQTYRRVEKDRWLPGLGGTCLTRGCLPSKMWIHQADASLRWDDQRAMFNGTEKNEQEQPVFTDRKRLAVFDPHGHRLNEEERKEGGPKNEDDPMARPDNADERLQRAREIFDKRLNSLSDDLGSNWTNFFAGDSRRESHLYIGHAKFVAPYEMRVVSTMPTGSGVPRSVQVSGTYFFLAPGGRPLIPDIPNLPNVPYLTSTEVLRQAADRAWRWPTNGKTLIVGASYIAVELAHAIRIAHKDPDSKPVSLFCRSEVLGSIANKWARQRMNEAFFSEWHDMHHNIDKYTGVAYKPDATGRNVFTLTYTKKNDPTKRTYHVSGDMLIVAAGWYMNSDTLDLAKGGIKTRGDLAMEAGVTKAATLNALNQFIKVNPDTLETTQRGVWALGDITGFWQFRHAVNAEAQYLKAHVILPLALSLCDKADAECTSTVQQRSKNAAVSSAQPPFGDNSAAASRKEFLNSLQQPKCPTTQQDNFLGMPWAVFSGEVAGVGRMPDDVEVPTEDGTPTRPCASERWLLGSSRQVQPRTPPECPYVYGIVEYPNYPLGVASFDKHGALVLGVERSSRRIVSVLVYGHDAAAVLHLFLPTIQYGQGLLDTFLDAIYVHPALPEIVRYAAEDARDELFKDHTRDQFSNVEETIVDEEMHDCNV